MIAVIKFYADAHIAKGVTVQLKNKSVDIIRCQGVGMDNASDLQHLAYAVAEGRTIVTCDQGFHQWNEQWLREDKQHFGIVMIKPEDQSNIGYMVRELFYLHQLVQGGAADLGNDLYNRVYHL